MVPNWDMGIGPKPGPWGTEAEEVDTWEGERKQHSKSALVCRMFKYKL